MCIILAYNLLISVNNKRKPYEKEVMVLMENSGIPEDSRWELQDDMVFRSNLQVEPVHAGDDPMWSSGSTGEMSWLLSEE